MTQAEIDILNKQKLDVTCILSQIVSDHHLMNTTYWAAFGGLDQRMVEYAESVAFHPEQHGIQEQLCLLRFFRYLHTYRYDKKVVKEFMFFAENVPQEGKSRRECYPMTPCQLFLANVIFGFWDINSRGEDYRMIMEVFVLVARKWSKTGFAALIATFYFVHFGDDSSEIYFGANSAPQAMKPFREVGKQLHFFDPHCKDKNSRRQQIKVTENMITWKQSKTNPHRSIQCLTSKVETKDGFNPEYANIDEYHAARDMPSQSGDALRNVLESGMGARLQPLLLITTTAGHILNGPCIREVDKLREILLLELTCPLWDKYR